VSNDLIDAAFRAESILALLREQPVDEADYFVAVLEVIHLFIRPYDISLEDFVIHDSLDPGLKRCDTNQHLVDKHADSPPVHREIMPCSFYHFRRYVLRSAAEGLSEFPI